MRTAAAYIRVSTDDQLEYSPDSQLLQIRRYAKGNGFLLPQQWVFVEEEGRSGRQSSKRPEFLRMIAAAKQSPKPFDAILVWKYSRFARSRQDSIVYKSMLRKELGIDVIDLGLVYGIEIDELGRAIITMTLTTPACPLTDLIEDECASTLAGLVEEFRIDWTWQPRWTMDKITPEGREQLAALGFNFDNMPKY